MIDDMDEQPMSEDELSPVEQYEEKIPTVDYEDWVYDADPRSP